MRLRGKIFVERSRWIRDAQQGVAIVSFADPIPSPPEPVPAALRGLALDLEIETATPFRVDNNVLKKLEAEGGIVGAAAGPDGAVTVDLGVARTGWRDIPLAEERDTLHLGIAAGPLRRSEEHTSELQSH